MNSISIQEYESAMGTLLIGAFKNHICLLDWKYRKKRNSIDRRVQHFFNATYTYDNQAVIDTTIHQLEEYFHQSRVDFDIPVVFAGTRFQIQVWNALMQLDYGKVCSYISLSRKLNNHKALRAVAAANSANAIAILIPCHRVIGANGNLTGYSGGMDTKRKLLELEGAILPNTQFKLF